MPDEVVKTDSTNTVTTPTTPSTPANGKAILTDPFSAVETFYEKGELQIRPKASASPSISSETAKTETLQPAAVSPGTEAADTAPAGDRLKDTQRAFHASREEISILKKEREEFRRQFDEQNRLVSGLLEQNQVLMSNFLAGRQPQQDQTQQYEAIASDPQKLFAFLQSQIDSAVEKRLSPIAPVMEDFSRRSQLEKLAISNPEEFKVLAPKMLEIKKAWEKLPGAKWNPDQLIEAARADLDANRTQAEANPSAAVTTGTPKEPNMTAEQLEAHVKKLTTETGIGKGSINASDMSIDTSTPQKALRSAFAKAFAQASEKR